MYDMMTCKLTQKFSTVLIFIVLVFLILYLLYGNPRYAASFDLNFTSHLKLKQYTCDDISDLMVNFSAEYYKQIIPFKKEIDRLIQGKLNDEGHSEMFPAQQLLLAHLAKQTFVENVCETGFNYGHSSLTFLTSNNKVKIYSFDIAKYSYTKPMAEFLMRLFPGRIEVTFGDSMVTIPEFVKTHLYLKCQVIFIDGGHNFPVANSDLLNFHSLADRKANIIVYDDYPVQTRASDGGLGKAWNKAKEEGLIEEIMQCTRKTDTTRGFSLGKFKF